MTVPVLADRIKGSGVEMNLLDQIAEARIQEAIDRGELRGLPGEGQPLRLEVWILTTLAKGQIDLVDDEQLAEKLKELKLGLKTEMVEKVTVHKSGFTNI